MKLTAGRARIHSSSSRWLALYHASPAPDGQKPRPMSLTSNLRDPSTTNRLNKKAPARSRGRIVVQDTSVLSFQMALYRL